MHKNRLHVLGFTLIELIIATIIIGILISISVPIYLVQAERAMGAKALENLQNIFNAEMMYLTDNESFTDVRADLESYCAIGPDDADWAYGIAATQTTFIASATRTSPNSYNGNTITINEQSDINPTTYPP